MIFILLFIILAFALFYEYEHPWREAILLASLTLGVFILSTSELLSSVNALSHRWILVAWIIANFSLLLSCFRTISRNNTFRLRKKVQQLLPVRKENLFSDLNVLVIGLALIFILTSIVAIVAPPNTWDSMTYHMSRVAHWITNQNLAYYPTNYPPQLYHPPFAEMAILHLQVITGRDQFANLVQWYSMLGSVVGVSLIAQSLGANAQGQRLSAILCATLPMGILQASSTQNDYVVSFWLICFVYFLFKSLRTSLSFTNGLILSTSLGLAMATKTTAYIIATPFLVWLCYAALKRLGKNAWQVIITLAFVPGLLNMMHYTRNFQSLGSFLGAPTHFVQEYKADIFGPKALISNIIKNISIHFATPLPSINNQTETIISWIHKFIGFDLVGENATSKSFWVASKISHEDMAPNFIHLVLVVIAVIYLVIKKEKLSNNYPRIIEYGICILSAFLILCTITKFQQWNGRHHLILFTLVSPFLGIVLSSLLSRKYIYFGSILLILASTPWLLFNESRPLIANSQFITSGITENIFNTSRNDLYFINRRNLQSPYIAAVNYLESIQCSQVGLSHSTQGLKNSNLWEYPLWVLLQEKFTDPVRIESINVKNYSGKKANSSNFSSFEPCSIVHIDKTKAVQKNHQSMEYKKRNYYITSKEDTVSVFTP